MDLSDEILHDASLTLQMIEARLPRDVKTTRDVVLAIEYVDALDEFLRIRTIVQKMRTWH